MTAPPTPRPRRPKRPAGRALALLAGLGLAPAPAAGLPVDLELVLAVDVSGSMDAEEQALQREGYTAALVHPEVIGAIRAGGFGRIALTYVEWAGAGAQVVTVPWTLVEDEATAEAFAARLAAAPVARIRGTSISGALAFSAGLFDLDDHQGLRRVIDVSGDGPNNMGAPVVPVRDAVLAEGITVNGLPIMLRPGGGFGSLVELDVYYADCVIGGPGAFVLPVRAPEELRTAIRQKLLLEIAGQEPAPDRPEPAWSLSPARGGGELSGRPSAGPGGAGRDPREPTLLPAAAGAAPRVDCTVGEQQWRQLWER